MPVPKAIASVPGRIAFAGLLTTAILARAAPDVAVPPGSLARRDPVLRDTALTMGTLPNGLRYYLRVNAMPAHRAELRLVVNAGSILEDADQRGVAHFLEHMAFEGTRHFPRRTLIDFLETSGMRFGADLNAHTTYDETVYELTLPTDVPGTLQQGLTALEDWASGGITLDSSAVVAQRGIVMGEWRSRLADTLTQRIRAHYDSLLFEGSPYLSREPIGDTALIETAKPGPIARFYHDWYRPDLMAIVVVGDFDKTRVEREIRERFGTIPEPAHVRTRPDPAPPVNRHAVVDVFRDRVGAFISIPSPAPPPPPAGAERQRLVSELLFQTLEDRLLRIRERPSRPFITASVERGRVARQLDVVGLRLTTWPDSLERAFTTAVAEVERVAQHGVVPATLALQKTVILRRLEREAASEASRPSRSYAQAYVDHYLTGDGLLLSPAQELVLARNTLPSITSQVLAHAARFWRDGAGEQIRVGVPQFAHVRPPTSERLLAMADSLAHAPLPAETGEVLEHGPLVAQMPTAGSVVAERRDTTAGVIEWTLSNGARVLFKPTENDPDLLLVNAWGPGGFSVMPDTLFFSPGRMVAKIMSDAAELGTTSHDALEQLLATEGIGPVRVNIGYADQSISLNGSPQELETLFQLLYLQFTAPKLDSATLESWQSLAKFQATAYSIDDEFNQIFSRGDARLLPVSTRLAPLVTSSEAMAVYRNRFGNAGEFTFTLVGAASAEQVRPLIERYVASLPSTAQRDRPVGHVKPFESSSDQEQRRLNLPKSQTLLVFDGPFPVQPDSFLRAQHELRILTTLLSDRLRERLREDLSATYSPQVQAYTYALPDEHYRVLITFDAAPRRMKELNRELDGIVESLRSRTATQDEVARASLVQRRQLENQLQEDDYWMRTIGLYDRLSIPLDRIPDPYAGGEVTPSELREAVERYLPKDVYIHITAMPRDSTLYTSPDPAATRVCWYPCDSATERARP